jgi:hypothetical protein
MCSGTSGIFRFALTQISLTINAAIYSAISTRKEAKGETLPEHFFPALPLA